MKTRAEIRTLLLASGQAIASLHLLACSHNDADSGEDFGQAREALTTTIEPCFDPSSQCTLTRTVNDDGSELIRIDKPIVIRRDQAYDKIVFQPGDRLVFSADGCVQTGGFGDTWKRYVRPRGDDSDHLYFGVMSIPGVFGEIAFRDLFPPNSLISRPVVIPQTPFPAVLHTGYVDDDYLDNGYNDHDDGNDDQCKISATNDGGPAHLQIQVTHGTSTTPTDGDWDLVSNLRPGDPLVFDSNDVDLNPRWGWQTPFRLAADYDRSKTNQITGHDEAWICSGHDNWREATATGPIFWNGHDTGFGDDDYNIKIQTRDVPDTIYVSGVTRGNSGADGNPIRMIKGEFDSDETVDFDEFDNIPWWKGFHDAVDEGDGFFDDGGAAARAKIDGHFAIMSGLVGLDVYHLPPASELHPVHALAIRIHKDVTPGDDAWAFFVRNWGDEGYCSSDQHYVNYHNNQYTFRLPRPTPTEGVTGNAVATVGQTIVQSHGVDTRATVAINANQDTFLTVNLGSPSAETFVVGEIHLVWPNNGATSTSSALTSSAEAAPDEDDDDPEEQIREVFESFTPAQQTLARSELAKLQPARAPQPTFNVPIVLTNALPPVVTEPPSVSTAPALRKQQRTVAKTTTLCAMTGGALEIDDRPLCGTLLPTTTIGISSGLPENATCLPDLVTVHLKTLDPSGTGVVTEFSYDGQNWIAYNGPFIARAGATTLFVRSHDNAGHSEPSHSVTLPPSPLNAQTSELTLLAKGNLLVDDGVSLLLPSGLPAAVGNSGSGQTDIGVAARVGNIWSVAPVSLRDRSTVQGMIRTSGKVFPQNQVTVTGSVSQLVNVALPDLGTCSATFGGGLANVSLEPSQTLSLAPGNYGPLSVKSRAKLILAAGTYHFQSVTLEPDALVQLDPAASSVLFVQSALTHRGSFRDAGGALAPVLIAYFGSQSAPIEGPFAGAIIAPNARVDLYSRADGYRGVFFAHDLEAHPNMTIRQEQVALIR